MAIIKTLLLQDTFGLRRIIWSLLVVSGCIDCVQAAITGATIAVEPAGAKVGTHDIYRFTAGDLNAVITCGPKGTPTSANSVKYRIEKDGVELTLDASHKYSITTAFDASANAGKYTCFAKDGTEDEKKSTEIIVTLLCTGGATDCGTNTDVFKCDSTTEGTAPFCACKISGVFNSICDECSGTCSGTKKCSPDTPATALPRKCVECLADGNDGCVANSKKPRCDATKPNAATCKACDKDFCTDPTKMCDETTGPDSGKCVDKPSTAAGTTGASGGTTGKADTTSSAGTVTSTACLVIASVVLALMI